MVAGQGQGVAIDEAEEPIPLEQVGQSRPCIAVMVRQVIHAKSQPHDEPDPARLAPVVPDAPCRTDPSSGDLGDPAGYSSSCTYRRTNAMKSE